MIQPPYTALEIGMLVVGVPAAAVLGVSQFALAVISTRVEKETRALGGDPPRYDWLAWGMDRSAEFWGYVRKWSERTGTERLRRSMRIAEAFLVARMVSVLLLLLIFGLQFFV